MHSRSWVIYLKSQQPLPVLQDDHCSSRTHTLELLKLCCIYRSTARQIGHQHTNSCNLPSYSCMCVVYNMCMPPLLCKLYIIFQIMGSSLVSSQIPALEQVSLACAGSWEARVTLNLQMNIESI